jgi:MFS family permease
VSLPERNFSLFRNDSFHDGVCQQESIFYITECLTVYWWAQASNHVGRRPILILGPLGLGFVMIFFGFSTKFWQLVLWRGFQGAFNGSIGVGKTILAELSDSTNVAYAYSFEPAMWCTGIIIG